MPGSGIDDSNIEKIARVTGAKEFHLTGRKIIEAKKGGGFFQYATQHIEVMGIQFAGFRGFL